MVNLANKTNTDLKLEYGPANLKTLIAYENNYTHMIRILYKWGASLVSANKIEDALSVLECGMKAGTDISEHIILLGRIYIEKHDIDNYNKLLSQVNDSQSLLKNKIISSLERIMYKNL